MSVNEIKFRVESSVLFRNADKGLLQGVELFIDSPPEVEYQFLLKGPGIQIEDTFRFDANFNVKRYFIPEITEEIKCHAKLSCDGKSAETEIILTSQKKWQIHVLHFSHTDTGYTDLPSRIVKNYGRFLEKVIKFCERTDHYPETSKFRWCVETGYQFEMGWNQLSEENKHKLLKYLKAGRVELTAIYLAHNTELYDNEILIRGLYFSKEFCRKYEIPLRSAMNTDIPGQPWAMVPLLEENGTPYLTMAVNPGRAMAPPMRTFYWQARDGSKILVWNTDMNNTYLEGSNLGLTTEYKTVLDKLPRYLKRYNDDSFPYDILGLRTAGANADNAEPVLKTADVIKEWNENWAYPQILLSTNADFMQSLEEKFARQIPVIQKAWPDFWVDTFGSVAKETGVCRVAHTDFTSAQTMLALAGNQTDNIEYHKQQFDDTAHQLLIADEIDWCSVEGVTNPDSKQSKGQFYEQASFAYQAGINAEELAWLADLNFFTQIKAPKATAIVFNPLSWQRSDVVQLQIPLKFIGEKYPLISDSNGKQIPCQEIEGGFTFRVFTFIANEIPPFGYKSFKIELTDTKPKYNNNTVVDGNQLENKFYNILFARDGSIKSIFDKESATELVDPENQYGFNQLIYEQVKGGYEPPSLKKLRQEFDFDAIDLDFMEYVKDLFPAWFPDTKTPFSRTKPTTAQFFNSESGPVFTKIENKSAHKNVTRLKRSVVLYDDIKRIEFIYNLDKREVRDAEGIYISFPFVLKDFNIEIDNAYSFFQPSVEQIENSNLDWQLVQKWLRMYNEKQQILWSSIEAPLVQLSEINSGKWSQKINYKECSVYSWPFNNYWWTNIPASQGGWNYNFRYAMHSSHQSKSRLDAVHFGWNFHIPMRAAFIEEDQNGSDLPETDFNFCELDKPNVIITAIKRAQSGRDLIVRLFEVEGKSELVNLNWNGKAIKKAWLTTAVEENIKPIQCKSNQVKIEISAHSIKTIRLEF